MKSKKVNAEKPAQEETFEKEAKGINLPFDELCTEVSNKTGASVEETKQVLNSFSEIFLKRFKMR